MLTNKIKITIPLKFCGTEVVAKKKLLPNILELCKAKFRNVCRHITQLSVVID
jgi:hypothetical protein